MIVYDAYIWVENRLKMPMNTASKVYIFRIHKESLIKESHLAESICSEEHKASTQIGDIHDSVIARSPQLIALVTLTDKAFGQKAAAEHIKRSRKQFAEVLDITKTAVSPLMAYGEEYIRMTSYAPNRLEYDFQAEQNKLVVFSEIYYPEGWHLYVDDEEYPIGRANYVLRAAVIPAGHHAVRMEFVPAALALDKVCVVISILAILLSLAGLCWSLLRRRK